MSTQPTELASWLLDRIADDEAVAREAAEQASPHWKAGHDYGDGGDVWADDEILVYNEGRPSMQEADHIARHDPARVLAECQAKRRIAERHVPLRSEHIDARSPERCAECGGNDWRPDAMGVLEAHPWAMPWPCPTLRLLALPYADADGYREEWAPQ